MFQQDAGRKKLQHRKWAKAAGDHATLSAAGNRKSSQYIGDLNLEMAENIRFKPAKDSKQRVRSVRPSCCAGQEELPKLSGELELTTGKAEIGYDEKKKDMVLSFVRHENDTEGREVQENKARVRTIHGQDRFRSNDGEFAQGAMEMRCEAARTPKTVMRRLGAMSRREGGDTTMDRVLPFQKVEPERRRIRRLRELEHESREDRSAIHSAASGVAAFAERKQQKQLEFRKKFTKAVSKAQENRQTDDYQLYIRKKWEAMRAEASLADLLGAGESVENDSQWNQAPEQAVLEDMSQQPQTTQIKTERS